MWEIRRQHTGEVLLTGEGDRPGQYDLVNRDLAGADLAAAEACFNRGVLKGSAMPGAHLAGLRLRYLVAPEADLSGANLSGVSCTYLDLRRASLQNANMERLNAGTAAVDRRDRWLGFVAVLALQFSSQWLVRSVHFRLALTIGSAFVLAVLIVVTSRDVLARKERVRRGLNDEMLDYEAAKDMTGVYFGGAKLATAILVEARLPHLEAQHASFRDADLRHADLRHANLVHADLSGADLRGTDFRDACMVDADLTGAVYDEKTRWPVDFMQGRHGTMVRAGEPTPRSRDSRTPS
jgi:uncharacterized protein YjbI with pentapeptide repeats